MSIRCQCLSIFSIYLQFFELLAIYLDLKTQTLYPWSALMTQPYHIYLLTECQYLSISSIVYIYFFNFLLSTRIWGFKFRVLKLFWWCYHITFICQLNVNIYKYLLFFVLIYLSYCYLQGFKVSFFGFFNYFHIPSI